ncbi:Carbohydrate esterase family 1 protein [Balamuthia mandrillaris]
MATRRPPLQQRRAWRPASTAALFLRRHYYASSSGAATTAIATTAARRRGRPFATHSSSISTTHNSNNTKTESGGEGICSTFASWEAVRTLWHDRRCYASAATGAGGGGYSEEDYEPNVFYWKDLRDGREFYILGTAHVSKRSAEEVKELIERVKPDVVMVELCEKRARKLRGEVAHSLSPQEELKALVSTSFPVGGRGNPFGRVFGDGSGGNPFAGGGHPFGGGFGAGGGNPFGGGFGGAGHPFGDFGGGAAGGGLLQTLLSSAFKYFYAYFKKMGLIPGAEFKMALEEAAKRDIHVVLGDQDVDVTMRKLGGSLTTSLPRIMEYLKTGGATTNQPQHLSHEDVLPPGWQQMSWEEMIEAIKNRNRVRKMVKAMRTYLPEVTKVMLDERDAILANSLMHKCKQGRVIVGVVGMAHMDGIEKHLKQSSPKITS